MNNILIIVGIFLSVLVICCFYRQTEKYTPSLDPTPWISKKTPIMTLAGSKATAQILSESVDPGAHVECQRLCAEKSGDTKNKQFMQVCIDTCIQKKWTNPNSKLQNAAAPLPS